MSEITLSQPLEIMHASSPDMDKAGLEITPDLRLAMWACGSMLVTAPLAPDDARKLARHLITIADSMDDWTPGPALLHRLPMGSA